jgi:hypothetical protein
MNFTQSENKKKSVLWLKRTIAFRRGLCFLNFCFNYIAVKWLRGGEAGRQARHVGYSAG